MLSMVRPMPRKLYWDSCSFLGLINSEAGKHQDCLAVWSEAKGGRSVIYTSFFTYAEVFKVKCEGKAKPLPIDNDKPVEEVLQQPFIIPVVVDELIGIAARRLMRSYPECKKPSDAVHLATALRLNVDEMHTYDGSDLLALSGRVLRQDGKSLLICRPIPLPPLPPQAVKPTSRDLFDVTDLDLDDEEA